MGSPQKGTPKWSHQWGHPTGPPQNAVTPQSPPALKSTFGVSPPREVTTWSLPPPPPPAFCLSVAPPAFASFYFPVVSSSGVSCLTNCSAEAAGRIDCRWGQCRVKESGPQCTYGAALWGGGGGVVL